MFDASLRRRFGGTLDRLALAIDRPWVTPNIVTAIGFSLGVVGAGAAWFHQWALALAAWLFSRLADGIDGPLARRRNQESRNRSSGTGGYLDIMADFASYGSFAVGVAHGYGGSLMPFLLVLLGYYLNGTAFLAFSSIGERSGIRIDDKRSLLFISGLAEGAETIAVHAIWCLLPGLAGPVAGIWAALVLVSATARTFQAYKILADQRE